MKAKSTSATQRRFNLAHVICVGMIVVLASCKQEWLDAKVDRKQVVPESLHDFQAMMDNVEFNYDLPSLGEVASDDHYIMDDAYEWADEDAKNAYIWDNEYGYLEVGDWNYNYHKILLANIVVDGLGKRSEITEADMSRHANILGQALFHRARISFALAQLYAPPYSASTARTDLGIPLRLSSDITLPSLRANVADVYAQIISDLEQAELVLPTVPLYKVRASKPAALAVLSRVYLSMGDFGNALDAAERCLVLHNDLLDYNEVVYNDVPITENKEILFHEVLIAYSPITWDAIVEPMLYQSYRDGDLRKELFFYQNQEGSHGFRGNYNSYSGQSHLFGGPATDEVWFTKAECLARIGRVSEAMEALNIIMAKRWDKNKVYGAITATDREDALKKILTERRKELVFRGLRWMDLRRLNQEEEHQQTITRRLNGMEYRLEPGSYRYTFPIPDDILAQTDMVQNKGWLTN